MSHYTAKTLGRKTLARDDTLEVQTTKGLIRLRVASRFLEDASRVRNCAALIAFGLDSEESRAAFCSAAYGYPSDGGDWPECKTGDTGALTRVARAVFKLAGGKGATRAIAAARRDAAAAIKAEAAAKKRAEAAKAKRLRALPPIARAVVVALNRDREAFGCQREHVAALASALCGHDITALVERT